MLAHPRYSCFPVCVYTAPWPTPASEPGPAPQAQDLNTRALQLAWSRAWFNAADTILKFFILFELGPPHFHFALGPENSVAGPAFSRICYICLSSPYVLCMLCVLCAILCPKSCPEKEERLGHSGLNPPFISQLWHLRLGACVWFRTAPAVVTPQPGW